MLEKCDIKKTGKHIKEFCGELFVGQILISALLSLRVPPDKVNMQSKSFRELVNQVGELYLKKGSNVSEF